MRRVSGNTVVSTQLRPTDRIPAPLCSLLERGREQSQGTLEVNSAHTLSLLSMPSRARALKYSFQLH